jgi:hypothetical protein
VCLGPQQYADLIYQLATGADLRTTAQAAASRMRLDLSQLMMYDDIRVVHSTFGRCGRAGVREAAGQALPLRRRSCGV